MSTVADFFGAGSGGGDQVAAPRSEGGRGRQTADIVIPIARCVLFGPTSRTSDTLPPSVMSEPSFRVRLVPAYPINFILTHMRYRIEVFCSQNILSSPPKILLSIDHVEHRIALYTAVHRSVDVLARNGATEQTMGQTTTFRCHEVF